MDGVERLWLLTLSAVATLLLSTAEAGAPQEKLQPRSPFSSNKTFGLGFELGNIEGLAGKLWLGDRNALDFGFGYLYSLKIGPEGDRAALGPHGVNLYADYLWHPLSLTSQEDYELPLYFGVGARFWNFGDPRPDGAIGVNVFGVRVPIGISFDYNDAPIDVFLQIVPTLDFYQTYTSHDVYVDVDVSLGVRFYFN